MFTGIKVDIPEPSTSALLAGLLGFACVVLRRRGALDYKKTPDHTKVLGRLK